MPLIDQPLLVCIIDDDLSVREALPELLRELGFDCRAFSSAADYLTSGLVGSTACVIADIGMPGMSGSELQRQLRRHPRPVPMIFITGQPEDCPMVLAAGAFACLPKPFTEQALLDALTAAIP